MTVSECLKEWLKDKYEDLDFSTLLTDFIEAPEDSYSLFRSPNRTEKPFVDGSKEVTEYYQFFSRKSTQLDEQRIENQQVLDDFIEFIVEKDDEEDYPDLSEAGSLTCNEISVTSFGTITDQNGDNAIYQITLAITYLKER